MTTAERDTIAQEIEAARKALADQPRGRQEVIEEFYVAALRNGVEESREADSLADLREWAEASSSVLALLRRNRGTVLRLLLETLRDADAKAEGDPPDEEELEAWGRLKVQATFDQARSESHTVRWLESQGVSRQRVNQWRQGGRLVGIPDLPGVRGYAYPTWQFTDALTPKPWVRDVLGVATGAGLDPIGFHLFMTNPEAGDDRSPLDAAEAGDVETAIKLVSAANAQGS
jgi:hypothetical protein